MGTHGSVVAEELADVGTQLPVADWVVRYLRERLLDPGSAAASEMALRPALQALQVNGAPFSIFHSDICKYRHLVVQAGAPCILADLKSRVHWQLGGQECRTGHADKLLHQGGP